MRDDIASSDLSAWLEMDVELVGSDAEIVFSCEIH